MVRTTYGAPRHKKKVKSFKNARGYRGGRSRLWRTVKESLVRAQAFAYIHRRTRKREFRRLWIQRINAAARMRGLSYSVFMDGLIKAGITLDRRHISEIAIHDPAAFDGLVEASKLARA